MESGRCLLCAREDSESHLLLRRPETQRWRQEFLRSKWPRINDKIALRKIRTGSKSKELRNLGALACKIRCKWEGCVEKVVLRLGGGEELDCT
jgi:hypothetical protein